MVACVGSQARLATVVFSVAVVVVVVVAVLLVFACLLLLCPWPLFKLPSSFRRVLLTDSLGHWSRLAHEDWNCFS